MSTNKIVMHFTFKVGKDLIHVEEESDGGPQEAAAFAFEVFQEKQVVFGSKRQAYPTAALQMIWWEEK